MSETNGLNRAKFYQLALFPMNNGATNVYFVLILSYIANFGNVVLGLAMLFASFMVTGMRVFDAITDPIIGALMDKTNTRFGKFRPFMVIGNGIMAISVLLLYVVTPLVPATQMWLRYTLFILLYAVWVIGYTFQTSVTRSAQAVLTNDPKQRPLFTVFNTIGSLAGMGIMQVVGMVMAWDSFAGDYNATWYAIMTPIGIVISIILTILAIIGTVYFFGFIRQLMRCFSRFHKNTLSFSQGRAVLPSLTVYPQFSAKTKRRMKKLSLVAAVAFAVCFIVGFIVCALSAGAIEFWHTWGWFQNG